MNHQSQNKLSFLDSQRLKKRIALKCEKFKRCGYEVNKDELVNYCARKFAKKDLAFADKIDFINRLRPFEFIAGEMREIVTTEYKKEELKNLVELLK
ncbi:MAG: hypothetical protein LBN08_07900 [Lactobacillales bacterium]|jgi:hypothetical protein|nr:hypothetical protein [Lactobacillales bacterium]